MSGPEPLARLLARHAEAWARAHGPGLVVGVCGPQGSGKTTACALAAARLKAAGLRTAVLALDDLYLPREARRRRAAQTHPLFATRGPPDTHGVALGLDRLASLLRPGATILPRFDKGADDRVAPGAPFEGPAHVVLLEGWCVGVRPEPPSRLAAPLNAVERDQDAEGAWRARVNAELSGPYAELWSRLHRTVVLLAPDWPTVCAWRAQAEAELRAQTGLGMTPQALARFMSLYERLTRWAAEDLTARADLVVRLDAARGVLPPQAS